MNTKSCIIGISSKCADREHPYHFLCNKQSMINVIEKDIHKTVEIPTELISLFVMHLTLVVVTLITLNLEKLLPVRKLTVLNIDPRLFNLLFTLMPVIAIYFLCFSSFAVASLYGEDFFSGQRQVYALYCFIHIIYMWFLYEVIAKIEDETKAPIPTISFIVSVILLILFYIRAFFYSYEVTCNKYKLD